jgi:D-sedoheptulose 7-phosphate isomerase
MDAARGAEVKAPGPEVGAFAADYARRLASVLDSHDWSDVARLAEELLDCRDSGRQVFLCGNGGSAANAIHMANDFIYGISKTLGVGLRVTALPANSSVITCLANDLGYETIFSAQLAVQARRGDVLVALSGSGNSPNILKALEQARTMGLRSYAILGYTGGRAKAMTDVPIHFRVDDMQLSEDLQLIVGHILMQYLYARRSSAAA